MKSPAAVLGHSLVLGGNDVKRTNVHVKVNQRCVENFQRNSIGNSLFSSTNWILAIFLSVFVSLYALIVWMYDGVFDF